MARAASPAHPVAPRLGYGISDADQHIYEAEDAVTRYLDPAFRHAFRWIEFDGRKTLLLNDRLYRLLPNPTFDPVGRPGAMEKYFRGNNPEGKSLKELLGPVQRLDPAFREKEARLRKLDEQGVGLCVGASDAVPGTRSHALGGPAGGGSMRPRAEPLD
jgi:hypothetical protein